MRKILLFINGQLGLKVIDFVIKQPDIEISGVVINSTDKRSSGYMENLLREYPSLLIFEFSENLWIQTQFENVIQDSDLAVSALFGHLIPLSVVEHFGSNIVNLHPSFLPLGKGSDPIPWAIIENQKQGVSIHVVEGKLDSGPVVAQSQIKATFDLTAGDIYELAMNELFKLFKEYIKNWPTEVKFAPQVGEQSFHQTSELSMLRNNLARGSAEVERSLRIVQALNFNNGRKCRLRLANGEVWEISLSMTRVEE